MSKQYGTHSFEIALQFGVINFDTDRCEWHGYDVYNDILNIESRNRTERLIALQKIVGKAYEALGYLVEEIVDLDYIKEDRPVEISSSRLKELLEIEAKYEELIDKPTP